MWNEFNQVVQCHNCGEIYVPQSKQLDALQQGRIEGATWMKDEIKKRQFNFVGQSPLMNLNQQVVQVTSIDAISLDELKEIK